MMPGTIFLSEVLTEMQSGIPFNMTYVTYDGKRKRMGDLIELENAKCTWRERNATTATPKDEKKATEGTPKRTRQPNHWENATRNVVVNNTQVRKVHIRLITLFNGKNVIW